MPHVRMPNGDVVAFPDDMPKEQIRSLIAGKFPKEARAFAAKSGADPYDGPVEGFVKGVQNIPAGFSESKYNIGRMAFDTVTDFLDPVEQNGRTEKLSVTPGAPIEGSDLLNAPAGTYTDVPSIMRRLPDSVRLPMARAAAMGSLGQNLRRIEETKKLQANAPDMEPSLITDAVGGLASAVEMVAPAAASIVVRNPAPLVAYFAARSAGTGYGKAMDEGNSAGTSRAVAGLYAATEAVTEAFAGKVFLEGGKTLVGSILKGGAVEGLTEAATEALQALVDAGIVGEEMTWGDALERIKSAGVGGFVAGTTLAPVSYAARKLSGEDATPSINVNPAVGSEAEPGGPAPVAAPAALPPPEAQLALPSPEAYAPPDIKRRQPELPPEEAPAPVAPTPADVVDELARDALKRSKQAETAALLGAARETVSPIGTFEAADLPAEVAIRVNQRRVTRGRSADEPISVEDMVQAGVKPEQLDAILLARRPNTAGQTTAPRDVLQAAKDKNIKVDDNFRELARRTVGSANISTMSQTQLNVLRDKLDSLPAQEAPTSLPIASKTPFTEKQYLDAVAEVQKNGIYTQAAIKRATGLKGNADADAVRDAMVRRGQLRQSSAGSYMPFDQLGEQRKSTPDKLPEGAFTEHVVKKMAIGSVKIRKNGKLLKSEFKSEAAASAAVSKIRASEDPTAQSKIEIVPAGAVGYGVMENRYDKQGDFLDQAVVESYGDEAAATAAATKLAERGTARPTPPAAEVLPKGKFILRKDGVAISGHDTAVELREAAHALREQHRVLQLPPPNIGFERAPGVTEAMPRAPKPAPVRARKPAAPAGVAGRVAAVIEGLEKQGNTRGLPLLGTKIRLVTEMRIPTGQTAEGQFDPTPNLIKLATAQLSPDMSLDEVIDVLGGIMDHETIHALVEAGVLGPQTKGWKSLVRYAEKTKHPKGRNGETYMQRVERLYEGVPGYDLAEDRQEEAIADVFRYWASNRRNVQGQPATVLQQIARWFQRLIRGMPESMLRSIESGDLVRKKFAPPGAKTPRAKTQTEKEAAIVGMAAAKAKADPVGMAAERRRYVRARDQSREDRYGRAGSKTVVGDTPSLAYATAERDTDAAARLADKVEASGIGNKQRLRTYLPEPLDFLERIAALQDKALHEPKKDAVQRAYRSLNTEAKSMLTALGVKVRIHKGPGEPYKSQADMLADVAAGVISIKPSVDQFGTGPDNAGHPMYEPSGVRTLDDTPLTNNDVLRIVFDVLGHGPNGLGYAPRDGYNAYHSARAFFSDAALPALATETLAQHAWQNYGKILRRPDGTLPDPMDPDFLPLDKRQYPEQKAFIIPLTDLNADPGVQATAEAALAADMTTGDDARFSVANDNADLTVVKLSDAREKKVLKEFHATFMGEMKEAVSKIRAATAAAREAGFLDDIAVGDRLRSQNYKGEPLPPMRVDAVFLRQWRNRPADREPYDRKNKKPVVFEFDGTQYIAMARVTQGDGPPANATEKEKDKWSDDHPDVDWSQFDVNIDLVRDRKMGGLRSLTAAPPADPNIRYSVNSPQFQSWFGQSAVNEHGIPMRVYHSTTGASFDEFDTTRSELGAHFGTQRQSQTIAGQGIKSAGKINDKDVGTHTYPVYLSIQRPLRLRDEGTFNNATVADQLADLGIISYTEAEGLRKYGYENRAALQQAIKAAGYDGVVYLNRLEGMQFPGGVYPADSVLYNTTDERYSELYPAARESWIAFEPTQIKSAIGNLGTYDPKNPDIRYSVASPEYEAHVKRAYAELPPAELAPLPKLETGLTGPIPAVVLAAHDYAKKVGLPVRRQAEYVRVDPARAERIAAAYEAMQHAPQDPMVQAAYGAMANETIAQYKAVKATGLKIEAILPGMEDPYPSGPRDVLRDIAQGHIWYFPTDDGFGSSANFDPAKNPLLAPTDEVSDNGKPMVVNDLFRVVHDFFGHGVEGTGFGARGEENAWQSHMRLFSERAVAAMTSETRGQNSWVNYGPYGAANRANPRMTVYADQKTGIMPEWTWREGVVDDTVGAPLTSDVNDTMRYSLGDKKLIDHVTGLKGSLKYLTEEEKTRITTRTAKKFVDLFQSFPDAKEMAAVAYSGRAKRGWYRKSAEALLDIFGINDAPRFAALLAALSPQTSVESNAVNALTMWVNWVDAGRPTSAEAILRLLGDSVQGGKGEDSVLDAWKNNTIRALATVDPTSISISGPKVSSFAMNLRKLTNEVTNDAWMANYANVDQGIFAAARVAAPKNDPVGGELGVKSPGYLAMSAVVRKAAETATRLTGEQWTPAEIQETIWSWAKTLYEKAGAESTTAKEILAAGGLSHAEIGATPDFATLFITGTYRNILERGGYGGPIAALESRGPAYDPNEVGGSPLSAEGSGFAQEAFDVHLRRAAKRLDAVAASRASAAEAKAAAEAEVAAEAAAKAQEPPNEADWNVRFSITSPLFDETYGARLPGGRLYGSDAIEPATALSQQGTTPVALSEPVDGGRYFAGHLADAQLRMAQDGIDGASMVYMRPEEFLKLAPSQPHQQQADFDEAIGQGMKFNAMPSIAFTGNDGIVQAEVDGAYAARTLMGQAKRIPVVLYPKGKNHFGWIVGFKRDNATVSMPNDGLQEFAPERRGVRYSVGSEAFNKWFRQSPIVDEAGAPKVVYHATDKSFDAFDTSLSSPGAAFGPGIYVDEDPTNAEGWRRGEGVNLMPLYAAVQDPLNIREPLSAAAAARLNDIGIVSARAGEPAPLLTMENNFGSIAAAAQAAGFDGLLHYGPNARKHLLVFENTKVKSAIGNRGTWSAADPDIRYSVNSPPGTRFSRIDPDIYSVVHRDTTSKFGQRMEDLVRSKTAVPVVGGVIGKTLGADNAYELRMLYEDRMLPIFTLMDRMKKDGARITDAENSYIAEQRAGSRASHIIGLHKVDVYNPLTDAIKALKKTFSLKEYEQFLYARHAPERNAFLRSRGSKKPNPSGMSEAEAAAVIAKFTREGKIGAMRSLDPLLNALRDSITKTRVDGGLLDPAAVSSAYRYWVPMQNGEDFDPFDQVSRKASPFTGRGYSVAGRESRPTVGRDSKAGDLLSNMILQDTLAVMRAEKAAFNRTLVEVIRSNPALAEQDIEILTTPPLKTVVGSDGRIRQIVNQSYRTDPGYFVTKIGGKEVVMKVHNPFVERALKGDFVQQTGPVLQAIGGVVRVLAAMRTTYNPEFVLTNLARDLQAAALNLTPQEIKGLSGRMLKGVTTSMRAVGEFTFKNGSTSTEHGRYYKEMLENGWTVTHMGLENLETVVNRVRMDAHAVDGWRMTANQAGKLIRSTFGALEATLGVAENGVRLSAYVEARRANASIAQAGYLAKNLTVNFNKRGERGAAANMLYMFFNAAVQSGVVIGNMAKSKKGQKYLAAIAATGFMLDILNRMLSDDENEDGIPDYDQFTEFQLQRNLIFPNPVALMGGGGPRYIKIPMPLGYNAVHNLGRNVANMFTRKNKTWVDSLASIATGTIDAFNPIAGGGSDLNLFAPTIVDPFIDVAVNKDFAGRNIVPQQNSFGGPEKPQSELFWSTTDPLLVDTAKFLNEITGGNEVRKGAIDWSPEVIDYWMTFAGGGVTKFLMDMKYSITEGAPLAIEGKFEDIDATKVPFVGTLFGNNVERAAASQYYDMSKAALTVKEEVKRFYEKGQPDRARDARAVRPTEYATASLFEAADRQLASLRKQIKNIANNTRMSSERQKKLVDRLKEQMNETMARTLKAYYRIKGSRED